MLCLYLMIINRLRRKWVVSINHSFNESNIITSSSASQYKQMSFPRPELCCTAICRLTWICPTPLIIRHGRGITLIQ